MRIAANLSAVAVLGLATPTGARADLERDRQRCESNATHPDIKIGACTRLIQSGRVDGADLAVVFKKRGLAYKRKRQYDRAIVNYSQPISLDPRLGHALNNLAWLLAISKTAKCRDGSTGGQSAKRAFSLSNDVAHLDTLAPALPAPAISRRRCANSGARTVARHRHAPAERKS